MLIDTAKVHVTHIKNDRQFVVERSDIRNPNEGDFGASIRLQSHKTQDTITFYYSYAEYSNDEDRELQVWVFTISLDDVKRLPHMRGYTLHVLND